jgi:heme-degrading monooxygenase HmoA
MIAVLVRIPFSTQEEADRVVGRFQERLKLVEGQPGFEGFELLRGERELISLTRWATRADLDHWMASRAHDEAHSRPSAPTAPTSSGEWEARGPVGHAGSAGVQHAPPLHGSHGSVSIYEVAIPGEV